MQKEVSPTVTTIGSAGGTVRQGLFAVTGIFTGGSGLRSTARPFRIRRPSRTSIPVTRISPDGRQRKVVGSNLGDGGTGTNGIAFNAQGRLFASDLSFADPSHPGGLWELDPEGVRPPVPLIRPLPTPEGFGFGPDGLA